MIEESRFHLETKFWDFLNGAGQLEYEESKNGGHSVSGYILKPPGFFYKKKSVLEPNG